jgi:cytidylate kinase
VGDKPQPSKGLVITIDGPAGAGKSTVAKKVAERLGFAYIDTGAMYRAITWLALENQVDLDDRYILTDLALRARIELFGAEGGNKVYLDGHDVTKQIREPMVNAKVSKIATYPELRRVMVAKQREMAQTGNVVMDGRDIGTVVFPDADLKVFLTAGLEVRVQRRYEELWQKGYNPTYKEVEESVVKRDWQDSNRKVSPLRCPSGAVTIDTTQMSIDQVVDKIVRLLNNGRS